MKSSTQKQCEICEKEFDVLTLKPFKRFTQLCISCHTHEIIAAASIPPPVVNIQKSAPSLQNLTLETSSETPLESSNAKPEQGKLLPVNDDYRDDGANDDELKLRQINDENSGQFITKQEQYWNAEGVAINAIQGNAVEKHIKIQARLEQWSKILFECRVSESRAYRELQDIRKELTKEERELLGLKTVIYSPGELNSSNVKPPTVKKARESAEDKATRTIAEGLYRREILLGDKIQQELFKTNPEMFSNGFIKREHAPLLKALFIEKGALSLNEAIEKSKAVLRETRQAGYNTMGNNPDLDKKEEN